jgi:2-methylcitrate dehydratase PrpD
MESSEGPKKRDAILPLVKNIVKIRYEDLSHEAREAAKRSVLDTLGAILAGSTAPGCQTIVDLITGWGGKEESTILANGVRVPTPDAVWANVVMGRSMEIDDCDEPTGDHPSVVAVPVALALAELRGGMSGKDIITAVIAGDEIVLRIRDGVNRGTGVSPWGTGTYAVLNAAAVAGKLFSFDETKMLDALGLAFTQMSNTQQWIVEGTLSGRVHHGLAGRAGLLSALLADRGITGPHDILEGTYGLYPIYELNQYDPEAIFVGLGKDFRITRISVKPFSSCKLTHGAIQGTLKLVNENYINPLDVEEIQVYVNQSTYNLCGVPEERKKAPRSIPDAQFSIYYTVAVAAVRRDVFLSSFTEEALQDPEVLHMARKVRIFVDPGLSSIRGAIVPTIVDIRMKKGEKYSTRIDFVLGHPRNPMGFEACAAKFKKCVPFSISPMAEENVERIIQLVRELEKVKDVRVMLQYL